MKHLTLIFLATCIVSCFGKQPENTNPIGSPLPAFSILLSDSSTYLNTQNITDGKPFMLFFFGPYCPYSKAQMQEITEHIKEFKNTNIYAITPFSYADMKTFYNTYHLNNYSNIYSGVDYKNFFAPYFQVKGVPYLQIYDSHKKLKATFSGVTSSDKILATVMN